MLLAQRLDLSAFRRDPLHLVVRVSGVDLSAAVLTYAVGLYPDIDPAFRMLTLGMAPTAGATGIHFVGVEQTPGGQPISLFEIIAGKDLLAAWPRSGEFGSDVPFAHELQVDALPFPGFTAVETTLFFGTLTIKGSVND